MRTFCGVRSWEQLTRLAAHLVQALSAWGFRESVSPLEGVASATSIESLRSAIKQLSSSYVRSLQLGELTEANFLDGWHLSQFFKKFRFECQMSDAEAHQSFLERNDLCAQHRLRWDIRGRMRQLLDLALPSVMVAQGRFGPGSTLEGARTRAEKLEYTRLLASCGHRLGDEVPPGVPGYAKLHAVPKDMFKLRTISVEPITCQWLQQAARATMLSSVHSGILSGTIMDQTLSQTTERDNVSWDSGRLRDPVLRQQARCIAAAKSGELCTLDLSNASDSISFEDVCDVFPTWVLQMLEGCRSECVTSTILKCTHPLRMYAGMGNATTFIVETLYFWALLTAIGEAAHLGKPSVSVFGDDIVMRNKVAHSLWFQRVLRESGVTLNVEKSGLSVGPGFREACGVVAYRNSHIPSTYRFYGYTASAQGEASYCDLVSRLWTSSSRLMNALGWALSSYDGAPDRPIISRPWRGGCEGSVLAYIMASTRGTFVPPVRLRPARVRRRFNKNLQRVEIKLKCVAPHADRIIVKDPQWGPGIVRSRGFWLYQLTLAGQFANMLTPDRVTTVLDCPDANRIRTVRRWLECAWSAYSVS